MTHFVPNAVQIPMLQDIAVIVGISLFIVLLFQRIKVPSILGFLVAGALIGPGALGLVNDIAGVEVLAEIGVILLLFVIGLEISLRQLAAIRKTVFLAGSLQVGLTIGITAVAFLIAGFPWNTSVFMGFLASLSSTAIVLKILQERQELNAPQGRVALGILIFQDIIVVPMMLFTPIIAGEDGDVAMQLLLLLGKTLLILGILYIMARWLIPTLLRVVVATRNQELFLLVVIGLCLVIAVITGFAGLSLALGAFLAGLILSESDYSHQATSQVIPFRGLFTSFFFVSIGMLLDLSFLINNLLVILLITVAVMLVKLALAALGAASLRYPPRILWLSGIALMQVGEFSFILSKFGLEYALLNPLHYQYFLAVSIVSMAVTPFLIQWAPKWVNPLFSPTAQPTDLQQAAHQDSPDNHLVIIGFGLNGKNVARAAKRSGIPYVIAEMNADTVRTEKAKGEPILYGDAMHEHIIHQLHLEQARVVVIAISDPIATAAIVQSVRQHNPTIHMIIRTRFVKEIDRLLRLGADEVIPEEFETSIEIFTRVLQQYMIPVDEIERLTNEIRAGNYNMLRPATFLQTPEALSFPQLTVESVRIQCDSGPVVNHTLEESQLRNNYGVTVIGIYRQGELITHIDPTVRILPDDLLYVTGPRDGIRQLARDNRLT